MELFSKIIIVSNICSGRKFYKIEIVSAVLLLIVFDLFKFNHLKIDIIKLSCRNFIFVSEKKKPLIFKDICSQFVVVGSDKFFSKIYQSLIYSSQIKLI